MNRFATIFFVASLVGTAVSVTGSAAYGTDKASVSWQEFSERSTFVFGGLLMKAEMLDPDGGPGGGIRCTYKVSDTFKGEAVKEVTFDVPREERVNTEVGTLAVVALRAEGDRWVLSVDGRSCWRQLNRMKPDFGGFPVYDIPAGLIRDLPPELSENVELLVPAGDGHEVRMESVFPMNRVGRELKRALMPRENAPAADRAASGAEELYRRYRTSILDAAKAGDANAVASLTDRFDVSVGRRLALVMMTQSVPGKEPVTLLNKQFGANPARAWAIKYGDNAEPHVANITNGDRKLIQIQTGGVRDDGRYPDDIVILMIVEPEALAAARAKQLKATIDSFELTLTYHGEQDKPYYALTLAVHEGVERRLEDPFHPVETITKAQAEKIIEHLASEGFLEQSIDVDDKELPAPPTPCYTMSLFSGGGGGDGVRRHELCAVLGWEMPLLKRLDDLRAVLDDGGDAARSMDLLLGRMSGHRKEWEKAEAADAIGCLVARLSADPRWQNGPFPILNLPPTASTEQVLSKVFEMTSFDQGRVKRHMTLKEREVRIRGSVPDRYTAALVETGLGEKIVLLQHQGEVVGWWSRVYEPDAPTAGETDAKAAEANIAAEVERLASPSIRDDRDAALRALVKIGKPAAPVLVKTLDDPRNDVRACAAEVLRSVLAADPTAAPNYHDREYWEMQIAQVNVGMSVDDAVSVLLPHASPEERKAAVQMGAWSGQSGFSMCRLDDYWTVTLNLVDAGREKLSKAPTLNRSVRPAWVAPPADYMGVWTTWFVNGQKAHEVEFCKGQYDGTFTAFHDDGSKSYQQHYQSGVSHGADTGYHRNGSKSYEGRYEDGKQVGTWRWWSEDGRVTNVQEFGDAHVTGADAPPG